MNDCKRSRTLMEQALYDELNNPDKEFFNRHLASCAACSAEFGELHSTLRLFKSRTRPEADTRFMETFWESLEPKLEKKKQFRFAWLSDFIDPFRFEMTWQYRVAGAVALLGIGIIIGEYFGSNHEASVQYSIPIDEQSMEELATAVEVSTYIERSKILLIGMMNFDPGTDDVETINLVHQKKISGELLTQAAGLKNVLKNPSQQQMRKLVSDIEMVLLQIANLDAQYGLAGIEIIKEGVKTKGIILKIHIQEMKENSKESTPNNAVKKTEPTTI